MPTYVLTILQPARHGLLAPDWNRLGPALDRTLRTDHSSYYMRVADGAIVCVIESKMARPYLCQRVTKAFPTLKTGNRHHRHYTMDMQPLMVHHEDMDETYMGPLGRPNPEYQLMWPMAE